MLPNYYVLIVPTDPFHSTVDYTAAKFILSFCVNIVCFSILKLHKPMISGNLAFPVSKRKTSINDQSNRHAKSDLNLLFHVILFCV